MRAIIKDTDDIVELEKTCVSNFFIYKRKGINRANDIKSLIIINEDEWDAEIYALLLWHFWND